MSSKSNSHGWEAVFETVRGASHISAELPNQDAVEISAVRNTRIAAVADGHGGKGYIRSEVGSRFAVEIATQELKKLLELPAKRLLSFHHSELEYDLANRIVRQWVERATRHFQQECFSDEQIAAFPTLQQYPIRAYGTTLLAAAASDQLAVFVQIGDGDILMVAPSGQVKRPFERDPLFIGNETASLCSADADQQVRITLKVLNRGDADNDTALILLSTDGYSNCFKDEASFAQVGKDYLNLFKQDQGISLIQKNLNTWLRQASDQYSSDDITVAMLYRAIRKRSLSKRASGAEED